MPLSNCTWIENLSMAYWLECERRSCDLCFQPSFVFKFSFITKQQKQQRNNRAKSMNRNEKCLKGQNWSCWQWAVWKRRKQQRSCKFPEEGRLIDLWGYAGGEHALLSQVRQHFLLGQAWLWNICSACLTSGNMTFSPVALCSGRQ